MNTKHGQKLILYNLLILLFISCSSYVKDTSIKYKELVQPDNNSLLIVGENDKYYFVVDEDYKKAPKVRKDTIYLKTGDILILKEYYDR